MSDNSSRPVGNFYSGDIVFTNGAFITPIQVDIHGIKQWRWIVASFEDVSFFNGKVVNPIEKADDFKELLQYNED